MHYRFFFFSLPPSKLFVCVYFLRSKVVGIFKPLLKPGTWDIPEHYKTWVSIPVVKLAKKSMHKVFNGEKGGTKKTGNVSITVNNVYSWK